MKTLENDIIKRVEESSRRKFIQQTAFATVGLVLAQSQLLARNNQAKNINKAKKSDKKINMDKRKLGTLEVSAFGAGCMSISANYGAAADKNEGINTIRTAFEKGRYFF